MNKHQTSGIGKQVKGSIKEAASTVTGNTSGKVKGKIEKAVGKAETALGNEQERQKRDQRERH